MDLLRPANILQAIHQNATEIFGLNDLLEA